MMMKLESLLEKDDQKKYMLLRYLDKFPNQKIKTSTIQKDLSISYYLTNNLLEQIIVDMGAFQLEELFNIEVNDSYLVFYEVENVNSTVFLRHYLRRSTQVMILKNIFLEKKFAINEFADDNFYSYAYVYRRYSALKESLKQWGIRISRDNHLVGNEFAIRSLLMNLFMVSGQSGSLYDQGKIQLGTQILQQLDDFGTVVQETKRVELFHFIQIALQRIENGHYMEFLKEETHFLTCSESANQRLSQRIRSLIDESYELPMTVINNEVKNLLAFLIVSCMIDENLACFPDWILERARDFSDRVQEQFAIALAPAVEDKLIKRMLTLLMDTYYFHYKSSVFDDYLDVTYFKKTYPEFFYFCQDYLNQANLKNLVTRDKNYLFYYLLLALITNIQIEQVTSPLKVCIDFSVGVDYNLIIEKDLKYFSTMNIHVTKRADADTDIIITDLVEIYQDVPGIKIIWLTPPRPEDWENLINRLVDLRQTKLSQEQESKIG